MTQRPTVADEPAAGPKSGVGRSPAARREGQLLRRALFALLTGLLLSPAALAQSPLAPPRSLMAHALSPSEISLHWVSSPGNKSTHTSIWRRSPGGDWEPVGRVPAPAEVFHDDGVRPETRYLYRVRLEDAQGASDWSNEAAGATEAVAAVQHTAPAVAPVSDARVRLEWSLAPGHTLARNPRLLVLNARGVTHELLPAFITEREPVGRGHRDLHTGNYAPGTYRVRGELFYLRPDGTEGAVASAWTELTVAPAALLKLRFAPWLSGPPVVTTGARLPAEVVLTRLPATSAGAAVTLTSSDPSAAQVPATVTVPWWRAYVSFTITAGVVTRPTPVTITATAGGRSGSLSLTVLPLRQVAVFRPSTAEWLIREVDGTERRVPFGASGDRPVPADYQGTGSMQIAVFRPATQEWLLRGEEGAVTRIPWGRSGDVPVPGDYLGLGQAQLATYRPTDGEWLIRTPEGTPLSLHLGEPGDQPVPADYLGLGRLQIAVLRPTTGEWFVRRADGAIERVRWERLNSFFSGNPVPAPGDYLGLGRAQFAAYSQANDLLIRRPDGSELSIYLSGPRRVVPADYLGLGYDQVGQFDPTSGKWSFNSEGTGFGTIHWCAPGDVPVPGRYSRP